MNPQTLPIDVEILTTSLGQHRLNEILAASQIKAMGEQIMTLQGRVAELEPKPELPEDGTE